MDKIEKPEIFQKLFQLFKAGRWEEGQLCWLELIHQQNLASIRWLKDSAQELWRRGQHKLATDLLNSTITVTIQSQKNNLIMEAIRLFSEYYPESRDYHNDYIKAFLDIYKGQPYAAEMANRIIPQRFSLAKFIEILDRLLLFQEGSYVKHKSGWGIGRVLSINPARMELVVKLQKKDNHRMDVVGAADCLIPLAANNFEVMLVCHPDQLKKEAEEQPTDLLKRIFDFHQDEISAREFKEYLCPAIISKEDWTKWWGRARKLLLTHPNIEANSGGHSKYRWRQESIGWEQEMHTKFDATPPLDQPVVLLNYLKHTDDRQNAEYFANTLVKLCQQHIQNKQPWYAVECFLVLQNFLSNQQLQIRDVPKIEDIVNKDNIIAIYNNLRIPALAQDTLELLFKYQPDWSHHLAVIFKKGTDLSRDTIYKYLQKNKVASSSIIDIAKDIVGDPLCAPDGLIWLARQSFNEKVPSIEGITTFLDMLTTIIRTGGTLKSLRQTEMVRKINKIFSFELIKKILTHIQEKSEAWNLYNLLEEASFLPANFKQTLQNNLKDRYPEIFAQVEHIYTTKEGLLKYTNDLNHILQVQIPSNTKAIGEALAFGDISENAELDAAREIQFQLMGKVGKMQADIARAKLIDFEHLDTSKVGVGCTVVLTDEQNNQIQYSILGPWDVDLSKGIISFLTPIAKTLINAAVGAVVTLPNGTYQIAEIKAYQPPNA